jgi:hypothetical protein
MICGIPLPDGLRQDTILPELLITPSTKGVLRGVAGVPEVDDVNVRRPPLCGGVLCGRVSGGGGCFHVCVYVYVGGRRRGGGTFIESNALPPPLPPLLPPPPPQGLPPPAPPPRTISPVVVPILTFPFTGVPRRHRGTPTLAFAQYYRFHSLQSELTGMPHSIHTFTGVPRRHRGTPRRVWVSIP